MTIIVIPETACYGSLVNAAEFARANLSVMTAQCQSRPLNGILGVSDGLPLAAASHISFIGYCRQWTTIEGTFVPEDRAIENKIIILALLQKAQERGKSALTRTQVHKLLFVSEQQMWRQRILSSGFRFIKMDHGPWSDDIEDTLKQLEALGLVKTKEVSTLRGDNAKLASLTETGSEFVRSIMEMQNIGPEAAILEAMEDALRQYGDLPSEELQEISHTFRNLMTGKTVHDTAPRKYLLAPRPKKQATAVLEAEESVKETLLIMEDREFHEDILDSMEQARRGGFRPYHPGGEIDDEGDCHTRKVPQ